MNNARLVAFRRRLHLPLTALACAVAAFGHPAFALNPPDTSVQMFQWNWNDLGYECSQWLGPQGYGGIQISPPQSSRVTTAWWGVYQPVDFRSLTSRFGDETQLRNMVDACHAAGVRVYADLVINHVAGDSSAVAGVATDGSSWDSGKLAYPAFSAYDFHPACETQPADYNTPAGRGSVQNCSFLGLPDLNSESGYVQGQLVNYMNKLLSLGIDGFRIDAAQHQAASSLHAMLGAVKAAHPTTNLGEPIWISQEVVPDGEVSRPDYIANGKLNEFLFTYAMRDAWRDANGASPAAIPSMMGSWNNWGGSWGFLPTEVTTVFINNWDTERDGSSMNAGNFSGSVTNDVQGTHRYDLANIFMLAQGYGEAQLFSGYNFSDKDANHPASSPYVDGVAQINREWNFIHRWSDISNMVKFRSAAHGQPETNWISGDANQIAFSRGKVGFVALNNSGAPWSRTFHAGLPAGTYCNVVNGLKNDAGTGCNADTVTVDGNGDATFTVPADSASSVPAVAIYVGQKPVIVGGTYVLVNPNSGKALDVYGASTADGARIDLWSQNGTKAQKWTVVDNGNGTYSLVNPNSDKALDIYQAAVADGSAVDLWDRNGTGAQQWKFVDNGDGTYAIVNPNSDKALDVYAAATGDGAKIDIWDINGTAAQKWVFVATQP